MYRGTVRQKQRRDPFKRDRRCDPSLVARRRHAKKVGTVHFLCLVQVTRIYMAVEDTLLGVVLESKRVPRCKEEAVLYKRIYGPFLC